MTRDAGDETQLVDWLRQLGGNGDPGWNRDVRDRAVAAMREAGADRLFPRIEPQLADPDVETRCRAAEALLRIDAARAVPRLLPLLDDPDYAVRWYTCGLLHDFGDERALDALIGRMKEDPAPEVRNTAAYALGGIGHPRAIPALIEAMEHDHEYDELGYSTSQHAATALDDILGTNETRIALSGSFRTLSPYPPDLDRLKWLARDLHRRWSEGEADRPE